MLLADTLPPEIHHWIIDWAMLGLMLMMGILLIILSTLVLAIYTTFVSVQTFSSANAPRWILICWLIPIIGSLATLKAIKRHKLIESNSLATGKAE